MLSGWREQGFGIGPISHREIVAWERLYRVRPSPAEVSVLRDLDTALREHHAKEKSPGDDDVETDRPMTPELFDSLFR